MVLLPHLLILLGNIVFKVVISHRFFAPVLFSSGQLFRFMIVSYLFLTVFWRLRFNDLCFSLSINSPTSLSSFAWYLLLLCSYRNRENVYDLFYLQWLLLFVFRAASRLVGNFLDTVRLLREAEPSLNSSSEDVTFPPKDMDMSIEFIKSSCV